MNLIKHNDNVSIDCEITVEISSFRRTVSCFSLVEVCYYRFINDKEKQLCIRPF
jgi:hypothetical protein